MAIGVKVIIVFKSKIQKQLHKCGE